MTIPSKYRFVIDENGEKAAVLIEINEYERVLEGLEELEALRAYDAAKESNDEEIPFDQAIAEIERGRV